MARPVPRNALVLWLSGQHLNRPCKSGEATKATGKQKWPTLQNVASQLRLGAPKHGHAWEHWWPDERAETVHSCAQLYCHRCGKRIPRVPATETIVSQGWHYRETTGFQKLVAKRSHTAGYTFTRNIRRNWVVTKHSALREECVSCVR
jgi:hypothetical protein